MNLVFAACTSAVQGYTTSGERATCLPHTGFTLWPVIAVGVALLLLGVLVARLSRTRDVR